MAKPMRSADFFMTAFARPSSVGAILPSSRHLARAMAQAAGGAQLLVELGAGTGAITQALRHLHPEVPTVVVEIEPRLADHLRRRFPDIEVRVNAAHMVLNEMHAGPVGTVLVSSLPFRSLPLRWRQSTSEAIEHFLLADPTRRLVQYTYQPRAPFDLKYGKALRWRRVAVIWRNAPPAWIWELRQSASMLK